MSHGSGLHREESPAAPSEPVAWAVVRYPGALEDGRIWRHRDKAARFHANATRNGDREYYIVSLYTHPAPHVTEAMMVLRECATFVEDTITVMRGVADAADIGEAEDLLAAITATLAAEASK